MRDLLEHQANAIEYVLHAHGINARVAGGTLSPRLVHFQLQVPKTVRLSRLTSLLHELTEALEVDAVRLAPDPDSGAPVLEVPRPDPVPVRLLPLARKVAEVVPAVTATLGLDTTGTPLLLRLDAPEVGPALIAGAPGAGKSSLLQVVALSLALHNAPRDVRLLLLDQSGPARRGRRGLAPWIGLEGLPHLVTLPVHGPEEVHLRLRWVNRLLNRRLEQLAEGEALDGSALVILLDGLDAVLQGQGARERSDLLGRIAAEGRDVQIHLVAATTHPDLSKDLHWGARLVGRVADADQAAAAAGVQGSGAEGLLGAGDFLAILGGDTLRFQSASVTPDEILRTVTLLQQVAEAEERAAEAAAAAPVRPRSRSSSAAPKAVQRPERRWSLGPGAS
jgi:S-DNA-T family DNA segregation ATPase FtsK/SpoIIIE